jgi:UPF0755 protein
MLRKILIAATISAAIIAFFGYGYYQKNYAANTPNELKDNYLYIRKNTNFEALVKQMTQAGLLNDIASFRTVAQAEGYDKNPVRAGRFEVQPNMGNKALVRLLKVGKQAPVKVSFNNKRLMEDIAGYLGKVMEADSMAFLTVFRDKTFINSLGYNDATLMTLFISNTYEVFWTTEPKDFLQRMQKEHDKFWTPDRIAKAKKNNLTPEQAYTVASIVEKETLANIEKARIAGVYLNRYRDGWKLEADPTVVYATKQFDLRRILKTHLAIDSPYNTYMYAGLPPGPIYLPSIKSIEAVLNPEQHKYMFFCAAPDNSGTHTFAETLAQHNANADKYHAWLNTQGRLANQK